jgi:hypothetical protein
MGQAELLCDRHNKFETLIFQILPDDVMGNKPALLSGKDSEHLGLITVQADEVYSLSDTVTDISDEILAIYQATNLNPRVNTTTLQMRQKGLSQLNRHHCVIMRKIHTTTPLQSAHQLQPLLPKSQYLQIEFSPHQGAYAKSRY